MAFQVSPGINVSEIDLTTTVPALATTTGAIAGVFRWGPIGKFVLVDSENTLAARYGKPTNNNYETFFTAANFLAYGNALYVSRAGNTSTLNAVANTSAVTVADCRVTNAEDFENKGPANTLFVGTEFVARYPGELGNSLKVSSCSSSDQYSKTINPFSNASVGGTASTYRLDQLANAGITVTVNSAVANVFLTWNASAATLTYAETKTAANTILQQLSVGDYIEVGNSTVGTQAMKIKSLPAVTSDDTATQAYFAITFENTWNRSANVTANTIPRKWEFYNTVSEAPGTSAEVTAAGSTVVDQISVVVVDEDGKFSGTPGTVLEVYQNLSRATDAKNDDGTTNYYKTVINDNSNYVWATADRSGAASGLASAVANSTNSTAYYKSFTGGADGVTEADATVTTLATAYDLFADASSVDISLLLAGKAVGASNGAQLANYLVDNIAEVRKDCVVFVSPDKADVVGAGVEGNQASNIVAFRNSFRNTSYAMIDSGYKYQYDKYNDVYRYIPLNGDIAGLTARTDDVRDPWFSPAGFSRGQIKNLVKLAYNPSKTDRDVLYKSDINPVVTFPGQGTVLYGDKTALGRSSAFDRINVRRLFIVLEKTIANASNSTLFEFNDEFTRAQFRNLVEPFLRDVQGRRGIYDFRVVCDETNNTAEVVDSNRFVGDIYVKPAKSINFIQLNFVAVRSGVEFTEVVGQF
jgi:phage tail sheath protein FI